MELGPIVLAVLYGAMWLIGKAVDRQKGGGKPTRPTPASTRTARRPETFEDLLAEMRRQTGTVERHKADEVVQEEEFAVLKPGDSWQGAEEVEERYTYHAPPVVVSMETEPDRPERVLVSYDRASEDAVARRYAAGIAQNRPRQLSDHIAFDARIRRQHKVARVDRPQFTRAAELRKAFIWREVLGPPVGLQEEERGWGQAVPRKPA